MASLRGWTPAHIVLSLRFYDFFFWSCINVHQPAKNKQHAHQELKKRTTACNPLQTTQNHLQCKIHHYRRSFYLISRQSARNTITVASAYFQSERAEISW